MLEYNLACLLEQTRAKIIKDVFGNF